VSVTRHITLHCVHRILFRTDESFFLNLENLFRNLLRTEPQLLFQRSLCNTLPGAFYFNDVLQN